MASRSSKLLTPIVIEARRLLESGTRPSDPEARGLAKKFAKVCEDEGMGDPLLNARWIAAFGQNVESRPGWEYLAQISAA